MTTQYSNPSDNPARARRLAVSALTAAKDDARYITWYSTWAEVSNLPLSDHLVRNALSNAFVQARNLCHHEGNTGPVGTYVGDYHIDQFLGALAESGFPL